MENFVFIMEIIGTVAFAVSGAITGIEKKMDIFGVAILGLTTAVGGGIIRDMLIGNTPPQTFQDPIYSCLLYTSPSPRDRSVSRMPSSA